MNFPNYRQLDAMDCGPTCLKIIAQYYGKNYSLQMLRDKCHINREGVSLGSVLKPSCKPIPLSTQFHKYLLPLHHEEAPKRLSRNCLYNLT